MKDTCQFCMVFVDLTNQARIWGTVPIGGEIEVHYGCERCFGARHRDQLNRGHIFVEFMEQLQPNEYACVATVIACSIGLPVQVVMDLVGHDGTEQVKDASGHPTKHHIGFTEDEFVRPLLDIGYAMCGHAKDIVYGDLDGFQVKTLNTNFEKLKPWPGVVRVRQESNDHAYALAGDLWFDPTTGAYVMPREAIAYYTIHRLFDLI